MGQQQSQLSPRDQVAQRVREHHERKKNIFFQHFDRISLGGKLMAATIAVLLVGITVISFSLRALVGNYMLEKTDSQLSQQANLVFNNIDWLSKTDNSSGLSGPNSYFLQIQYTDGTTDADGKPLVVTPLLPQLQDGIVSVPVLPTYGNTDGITLGKVFTAPAVAKQVVEVQASESSSGSSSDASGNDSGTNGTGNANGSTGTTPSPDASGSPAPGSSDSSDSVTKVLSNPKPGANHAAVTAASAPWRIIAKEWTIKTNGAEKVRGVVYIGLSMSDQIDTLKTLTYYCIVVGIAVVLLGGSLSTLIIQHTLQPLKRMEKTAAKIAAGDLSQRIPSAPENTEVGSLAASLNTMLTRIEVSFHEQEETTEKMKRFVSDASHELRTPLAAIHGYAELYKMQRDMPGALERADESIEHIERSSQRMTVLVEDLLSLARLDEGRGIDVTGTVNLSSLVTDAMDDLHALDPDRAITRNRLQLMPAQDLSHPASLQLAAGDWDAVTLHGDASRLRQVVTNIVGNIHRYTPDDSPAEVALGMIPAAIDPRQLAQMPTTEASMRRFIDAAEVGQSMQTGYRYAVLRFIDHGPGVPAESRSKIFERFYTADPSRARQKGGTGLGMAIAQSVVKAHHGFICATGTDGGGLTFTVILPVERIAPAQPAQTASGASAKESKAKTSWFSGERKAKDVPAK
ncbi:HAMP domain-containing histidine kinase [Bifidobacterium sp. LC6]|uniref:histidine kinase n=2 Tax=Bifidobacterium colobi TaxID=2809026 RepID=A0ABS5UW95_9BIFI|nr:HAMP domain-containing sensor histidine kinase [Bifidobacterium colobi]MBT1174971.1 HAMP domain-containing histidine kinase [Bifidobacterium colobi]